MLPFQKAKHEYPFQNGLSESVLSCEETWWVLTFPFKLVAVVWRRVNAVQVQLGAFVQLIGEEGAIAAVQRQTDVWSCKLLLCLLSLDAWISWQGQTAELKPLVYFFAKTHQLKTITTNFKHVIHQREFFLLGLITGFCFGGSCKQLVFKFLFLRQRPFMQTQSDCIVSKSFSWSDQKQEVQHSEKNSQQYRGKSSSCHSSFSSTPSILRRASVVATDSWRSRLRTETGRLQTLCNVSIVV